MHQAAAFALVLAASFGVVGPMVARRVVPAAAVWLLSVGGLLSALSGLVVLGLLSMTLLGQYSEIAEEGHWSIAALHRYDPVRRSIAALAMVMLCLGLLRFAVLAIRKGRALSTARRACAGVASGGDLVVIGDAAIDAYALPGRPGRIVITRGMLRLLDADERCVLLTHERSHLRHHHHWHVSAARAAAALNPLLAPLPLAQSYAVERWADEDAARRSDRRLAAATLARVAHAAREGGAHRPAAALAATGTGVDGRVAALQSAPPRSHPMLVALAAQLAGLSALAACFAARDTVMLFVHAGLRI